VLLKAIDDALHETNLPPESIEPKSPKTAL